MVAMVVLSMVLHNRQDNIHRLPFHNKIATCILHTVVLRVMGMLNMLNFNQTFAKHNICVSYAVLLRCLELQQHLATIHIAAMGTHHTASHLVHIHNHHNKLLRNKPKHSQVRHRLVHRVVPREHHPHLDQLQLLRLVLPHQRDQALHLEPHHLPQEPMPEYILLRHNSSIIDRIR